VRYDPSAHAWCDLSSVMGVVHLVGERGLGELVLSRKTSYDMLDGGQNIVFISVVDV